MFLKIHISKGERIVALCDADLIGKRITDGKVVLDLVKYSSFYKGEKVNEEKAIAALLSATSTNIVGAKSLATAEKAGVVKYMQAKNICGVPHVQTYSVKKDGD